MQVGLSVVAGLALETNQINRECVLPDWFKLSELMAGLSQALYRATGEPCRRNASRPHQWLPNPGSVHRCGHQPDPLGIFGPEYT